MVVHFYHIASNILPIRLCQRLFPSNVQIAASPKARLTIGQTHGNRTVIGVQIAAGHLLRIPRSRTKHLDLDFLPQREGVPRL